MQIRPRHVAPFLVAVLLLDLGGLALRWSSPDRAKVAATAVPAAPSAPAVEATASADPAGAAPGAAPGERAIKPAPEVFDGPLPSGAVRACSAHPGPPASGGTWAVIIGINDYPGSGPTTWPRRSTTRVTWTSPFPVTAWRPTTG